MSDTEGHEFNENHIRPVPLEEIPRHTWEVTIAGRSPRQITTHMAIRPTTKLPGWTFSDFTDNEDGTRIERIIELLDADQVISVVLVRSDGSRKEMVE